MGQIGWVSRLQDALNKNTFVPFRLRIQPIADPGWPCRSEVLLRLDDGDGGLLGPALFLPAAERYGLMPAMDKWVLN